MRSHFLRTANTPVYIGLTIAELADNTAPFTYTFSPPAGVQEGDLLLAFLTANNANQTFTVSGWTESIDSAARGFFYKTAGASEGSTTWTGSANGRVNGIIVAYRYSSLDVVGALTDPAAADIVAPSITLTSNKSVVFGYFGVVGQASATFTTPSGFDLLTSNSDASAPSIALFRKIMVPSGATGTASSTASAGTGRGFLVGVKPA